jgi:hypothetical protein
MENVLNVLSAIGRFLCNSTILISRFLCNFAILICVVILGMLACASCSTTITKSLILADTSAKSEKFAVKYDSAAKQIADTNLAAEFKKTRFIPFVDTLATSEQKMEIMNSAYNAINYEWTNQVNTLRDDFTVASGQLQKNIDDATATWNSAFGETGWVKLGLMSTFFGAAATFIGRTGLKAKFATNLKTALEQKETELSKINWTPTEVAQWSKSDAYAAAVANGCTPEVAAKIAEDTQKRMLTESVTQTSSVTTS